MRGAPQSPQGKAGHEEIKELLASALAWLVFRVERGEEWILQTDQGEYEYVKKRISRFLGNIIGGEGGRP